MQSHVANGISHFEISGPDATAIHAFYRGVFAWIVQPQGPGYALVETPAGSARGAIVEAEEAALTVGIVVPDVERTVAAAIEWGGAIAMPMTDNGWVKKAMLVDPAGNKLTVIQA